MTTESRGKTAYAMLTSNCNLTCNYCIIRNAPDNYDRNKFIKSLEGFNGRIILFGGEPTLYKDRLIDVYYNERIKKKIKSITTNLMILDDDIIEILKDIDSIGTSWNPSRFRKNEYDIWINNINSLFDYNISVGVLATMTKELVSMDPKDVLDILNTWNYNVIRNVKFELCISDYSTPDYFKRCDEWLCELYKIWNCKFTFKNVDTINRWYYDCSNIYTIRPDGTIVNRCPQGNEIKIPEECYSCERVSICKPCQLQSYCSYMYKFATLVKEVHDCHHDSSWLNNIKQ